ncbi:MAG: hypothetical protein L6R41_003596 [Letrouitia leprolyta]|nr:MAG: hypothetical protein L6R41_003596 [Letrouitia leprolyta]
MHATLLTTFSLLSSTLALPTLVTRDLSTDEAAKLAVGGPPNGGAPKGISQAAIKNFQAVNFLENIESSFFESGLYNLSNSWYHGDPALATAIDVVSHVHAQELIHVATAKGILQANNATTFDRCQYNFPVSNAAEFFSLANVITSVGIGGVINLISGLAESDAKIVQGPASILSAEARHDAFFRAAIGLVPTPTPFDTRLSAQMVLSFDNQFIVPGSCGANMPSFVPLPALTIVPDKKHHHWYQVPATGTGVPIKFAFDTAEVKLTGKPLFVAWVNQANKIAYSPATLGGDGYVDTIIPEGLAGMAFGALTEQDAALDVNALTPFTLAGPAPVQIS